MFKTHIVECDWCMCDKRCRIDVTRIVVRICHRQTDGPTDRQTDGYIRNESLTNEWGERGVEMLGGFVTLESTFQFVIVGLNKKRTHVLSVVLEIIAPPPPPHPPLCEIRTFQHAKLTIKCGIVVEKAVSGDEYTCVYNVFSRSSRFQDGARLPHFPSI